MTNLVFCISSIADEGRVVAGILMRANAQLERGGHLASDPESSLGRNSYFVGVSVASEVPTRLRTVLSSFGGPYCQ